MTASEILQQAKAAYGRAESQYRDELLAVGRLLHEFVLAYLESGDDFSEPARLAENITRRHAVDLAAVELGVSKGRINSLIVVTMTAELLGDGCGLGKIPHGVIYRFRPFVQRRRGTKRNPHGRCRDHPASEQEVWEVKPKYAERAKQLFRLAIAEGFAQERADKEVAAIFKGDSNYSRRHRLSKLAKEGFEKLRRQVKVAAPGDVAEMCMDLVNESDDPAAVAASLIGMLEKVKMRKRVPA